MNDGWTPISEPPDTDTTVLIACPRESEPVWMGYFDSENSQWCTVDHMRVVVTHWRHLPEAPRRAKKKLKHPQRKRW